MNSHDNERFQVSCDFDDSTCEYVYTIEMSDKDQDALEEVFRRYGMTAQEAFTEFFRWTVSRPVEFRAWYENAKEGGL